MFAMTAHRLGTQTPWHYPGSTLVVIVCSAGIMEHLMSLWSAVGPQASFGPVLGLQGQFSIETAGVLGAFTTAMVLRKFNGQLGMRFLGVGLAVLYTAIVGLSYGSVPLSGHMVVFTLFALLYLGCAIATLYLRRPLLRSAFVHNNLCCRARTIAGAANVIP